MYGLVRDSLFTPKNLLKYRNKSGFFTFIYIFLLTTLVSIGGLVYYFSYTGNSVISEETTGCSLISESMVCAGAAHDSDQIYAMYGLSVYFLNETETITDPTAERIVFKGNSIFFITKQFGTIRMDATQVIAVSTSFNDFLSAFASTVRFSLVVILFLSNMILVLFVSLLGTIPFFRLRRFIEYKKIFKLVVFAMTPFSVLLTFYNLLALPDILVVILMFFSYRSLFVLQRVLTEQTFLHLTQHADGGGTTEPQNPSIPPQDETDPEEETKSQTSSEDKDEEDPYAPSDDSKPDNNDDQDQ